MKSAIRLTLILIMVPTYAFAEPSAPYHQETTQVKTAGKIVGRVRAEGPHERPAPLKVYKNRDFCGATVPNESFVVNPEGGLRNAVIIVPGFRREKAERQIKTLILDNKNCAFVPHVQVAPVRSELLLLNSDPILHDVHARLGLETLFNVGLPTWRQVKKRLTRTGIVTIDCDVLHTWMTAYIVITSDSYYAVSDQRGEFIIEGVPAGTYEVRVWHEKLGSRFRRVTVSGGSTLRLDLVYKWPSLFKDQSSS